MTSFARRARWRYPVSGVCCGIALATLGHAVTHASTLATSDLADLSLEQLGSIIVTSVSRREERLGSAAASVYVISAEDIRRPGATSIPEALRLAPNLLVARADANQYAISAREAGLSRRCTRRRGHGLCTSPGALP